MKIFLLVLFVFFVGGTAGIAQEPDISLEDLQKSNADVAALFQRQEYKEALPIAERSLEMARELFGEKHIEAARVLRTLGYLQYLVGDSDKALVTLEESFSVYQAIPDLIIGEGELVIGEGELVAKMLETISSIRYQKNSADGEKAYQTALEWRERYNGKDSSETLTALGALAEIFYGNQRYEESAALFKRFLEINSATDSGDPDAARAFHRCECAFIKAGKAGEFESFVKEYRAGSKETPLTIAGRRTDEPNGEAIAEGASANDNAMNLASPVYPPFARGASEDRIRRQAGQSQRNSNLCLPINCFVRL